MSVRISVAISTLGRPSIGSLLESLVAQKHQPFEVAIADQGPQGFVQSAARPYMSLLQIHIVPSSRGVSIGRNAAAGALSDCDAIFFTDDDCTLTPDVLALGAEEFERGTDVMTGRVLSSLGERGQPSVARRQILNRTNVWPMSLEANMLFSASSFRRLNGFVESLGVGTNTPWQSGEGTEVLIRAIDSGMIVVHDPNVLVVEDAEPVDLRQLSRKTRQYARGTGRVYALHYSFREHLWISTRPVAGAVLRAFQGRFRESWLLLNAGIGRFSTLTSRSRIDSPSRFVG
ncbi:glycosyltransferase family 2 protein [Plantibacter sp. MMLR14_011]|uniref:glycosyltransferase family 2 protein n=1 Tax=Plantibacter sp. MMLR14_011 TaxID=1898746 RepID=UPI0009F39F3D|nr:glycosyltransferase family A protein [Plantibacter sp. MMLR14_011]